MKTPSVPKLTRDDIKYARRVGKIPKKPKKPRSSTKSAGPWVKWLDRMKARAEKIKDMAKEGREIEKLQAKVSDVSSDSL